MNTAFNTGKADAGLNYIRIPIGASDFSLRSMSTFTSAVRAVSHKSDA